jgi:hypothetical protein
VAFNEAIDKPPEEKYHGAIMKLCIANALRVRLPM